MISYKELWYDWMGGNEVLFLGINGIREPNYDAIMQIVSWLGRHENFPIYLSILLAWVGISLLRKTLNKHTKWFYITSWAGIFTVMIVGYGIVGMATKELKDNLAYPRPYVVFSAAEYVEKDDPGDTANDFRSFPSGHVAFTTLMVVALWPLMNNFVAWSSVFFVALMGWSRVSLGVHFPSDVVVTALIFAPLLVGLRNLIYFILRKFCGIKC